MIPVWFDYATPSVLESTRDQALVGLSANRRRPVSFRGKLIRHSFLVRVALRALGETIWSSDSWSSFSDILDPIITVHPDGLVFEAFSRDQSVYAQLKLDAALFAPEGETRFGTTNVDFTAWLWAALAEIRTHRETWLRVESEGFEVKTAQAGGRYERKVEIPESWIRGFLHLQYAMAIPGTRLSVRPVDLLAPIRFLRYTKSKVAPRALRFEFHPDQPVAIVLEPWEKTFLLKGSEHACAEKKVVRNWGRRRLKLLEPLLPFADEVEVYLKGRAMPSFYLVKLPGMSFTLGLSGFADHQWTEVDGFASLSEAVRVEPGTLAQCLTLLRQKYLLSPADIEQETKLPREVVAQMFAVLCRQGRLTYDLASRKFRCRELLETDIDESNVFPPSVRFERARKLVREGGVQVTACEPQEAVKTHRFKTPIGKVSREVIQREWQVCGTIVNGGPVEIVVKDNSHIIFGKCYCQHFREHILARGPCEEMLALFLASQEQRCDLPVSREPAGPVAPTRQQLAQSGTGEESPEAVDEGGDEE